MDRLRSRVLLSPDLEQLLQLDHTRSDRTLDEHVTSGIQGPFEAGNTRVEALPAVETTVHLVTNFVPVSLPRVFRDPSVPEVAAEYACSDGGPQRLLGMLLEWNAELLTVGSVVRAVR